MNRMSGTVRNTIDQGVPNYDQPGTQLFTRIYSFEVLKNEFSQSVGNKSPL